MINPLFDDAQWVRIGNAMAQPYIDAMTKLQTNLQNAMARWHSDITLRRPYRIAHASNEFEYYTYV